MPRACAASSARAICLAYSSAFRRGSHSAGDRLAQRLPFEQLHHGVGDAVVAAEVVNGEDIGMGQRRDGMCLALEARQAIGIGRKLHRQDFERNLATQFRVARAIDLAHATGTDRRDDLVDADA